MSRSEKGHAEFIEDPTATALRAEGRLHVGVHTYGAPRVFWWGEDVELHIGRYCSIAAEVKLILGGNHRGDWVTTYPFSAFEGWPEARSTPGHPASKGDVVIGNDVWLGHASTVLSGVTIGDGAIIAAQAVVTKDVSPYAVVAGNPGRVVAHRFEPPVVEALLRLRWWDWSDGKVRRRMGGLLSDDVVGFLTRQGVPPMPSQPTEDPVSERKRWRRSARVST